jgi:hypothetical protein
MWSGTSSKGSLALALFSKVSYALVQASSRAIPRAKALWLSLGSLNEGINIIIVI